MEKKKAGVLGLVIGVVIGAMLGSSMVHSPGLGPEGLMILGAVVGFLVGRFVGSDKEIARSCQRHDLHLL